LRSIGCDYGCRGSVATQLLGDGSPPGRESELYR
jgi:hypothetical protein